MYSKITKNNVKILTRALLDQALHLIPTPLFGSQIV